MRFSKRHDLKIHGHTLIWDQSTPNWAKEAMLDNADWSPISRHFSSVLSRYRNDIHQWNVVNEPIDDPGGRSDGLRRNTFLRAFGPDYIRRSFEEARMFAPQAKLYINDYGFDYENHVERYRRTQFLKLIERLKKLGSPLDAVGIQAHLDLSKGPLRQKTIQKFLGEIAAFGVDILISELDVKEDRLSASLAERDNRVANEAKAYLEVALSIKEVKGVITWGLSDSHSWLQDSRVNRPTSPVHASDPAKPWLNRGLPYDARLGRKPMHRAIETAFAMATS